MAVIIQGTWKFLQPFTNASSAQAIHCTKSKIGGLNIEALLYNNVVKFLHSSNSI